MTQLLYAYVQEENHKEILQFFLPDFPKDFQEKILKYRRWEDIQLTLLGRLLLKHGLKNFGKDYKEEDLLYSDYHKPRLKCDDLKFNISHSGTIAVCIITDTNEVGIDIEKIQDINIEDFNAQMLKSELQRIQNAQDCKKAFFDFWTQKEAVIKANGKGLSIPLNIFEVINNHTKINDEDFFLKEIEIDQEYKCYLAFKDEMIQDVIKPKRIQFFEKGKMHH